MKLVKICLHAIVEEYRIFLENLSFSSFSKLMEAPRLTKESMHRTSRSSSAARPIHQPTVRPAPRKRSIVATIDRDKRSKTFNSKRSSFEKRKPKESPCLPPFPCSTKNDAGLLERWVKDQVIRLLFVELFPSLAEEKDAKYCPYH